jgi:gliding motility-associated-like protein
MKRTITIILLILNTLVLSATHNRAGEITYVQISDLTYEITITTFTYTLSQADRPQLNVSWGDNSVSVADRESILYLPNYYKRNIYRIKHTYPGPGVYKIVVQDPNRNYGVKNIPNSVNVVFSISTILIVNPAMGHDSTPVLLNPPYDKAALGYIFIHNPAAYDPDGDSLSYKMAICTREDGKPIDGYTLPPATHYIKVDSISGDLIWNTPVDTGKYNVAMDIEEWRNGRKIGMVERDMQIEVYNTKNKPPVNSPLKNLCVEAGQTVNFIVSATDPNNDSIFQKATSGIFSLLSCPATFSGISSAKGFSSSRFTWTPCFSAVRNQPYNIIFKADDDNSDIKLSDIDNMTIKVLGPSPVLLNAVPQGKFITLGWSDYGTAEIAGFAIYRREGTSTFSQDSCLSGIPASTGFVKVGYISGSSTVSFTDTENGQGLLFGKEYTYRIVAVFNNGTESKASNELTSTLVSGVPIIKNVSVRNTDQTYGSVFLSWKKPLHLDTIPDATGPYEYIISRADGINGTVYSQIKSITTADLNDTVYIDTLLNTQSIGHIYKIELWNRKPGKEFMIGDPGFASSVFIVLSPGDRKIRFVINRNVPWINTRYDIYRLNTSSLKYDLVGTTSQLEYIDAGLVNKTKYTYYIKSTGGYTAANMPINLINLSQKDTCTSVDNEPPCIPDINVTSQCDKLFNLVSWSFSDNSCLNDVAGYNIFFKQTNDENLELVKTIHYRDTLSFQHYPPGGSISGCYAVSAFDSLNNESKKSVMICVDSCNFYEIPNVFTPNGDNINDRLIAKTSGLVDHIDFKLYNRSGLLIFSTDKPRIDWDGTYNGRIVSPGVYFYQCDVYERRISGLELFHIPGFIHVITTADAKVTQEVTK